MSSNNPGEKKKTVNKFNEIMKTVSKINKAKNSEMKTFKLNPNQLFDGVLPKSNISNSISRTSSIRSSNESINSNFSSTSSNTSNKNSNTSLSKEPLKEIRETINTNNSKKISKTEYAFLLNFLKQKSNNNGEGILKKMGNSVKGFGASISSKFEGLRSSNGTSAKNSGPSFGNKVKSLGSSIGNGVKGFGSSISNKFKDFGSSNGTSAKNSGPSFGNKVKSLGSSISNKVKGLGSSIGTGYDSTKQFIVNTTNPEKNVIINISEIKEISQIVKNDCIYIDITNLIGDYNFSPTLKETKYFEDDALLNTIIYSIISNNKNNKDNKNIIIYFTRNMGSNQKIYIYNVNENNEYIHTI